MENKYKLDKDDLGRILMFNMGNIQYFNYNSWKVLKNSFDRTFFNDLLIKRSDLKPEYDEFNLKMESHRIGKKMNVYNLWTEIFDNKIEIKDFIPQIFQFSNIWRGDKSYRLQAFKKLQEKDPDFILYLHDYIIKNKTIKDSMKNDLIMADAYFQILKSKNTNKDLINKEEILSNIKFFNIEPTNLVFCKKKINAYISIFKRDQKLYNYIMDDMGEIFENYASVANIMEEKIKYFPQDIAKKHGNEYDIFDQKITFKYEFDLNKEWIVSHFKVKDRTASDLKMQFYKSLFNYLQNNYSILEKSYSYRNVFSVSSDTKEGVEKVKDMVSGLMKVVPNYFEKVLNNNLTNPSYMEMKKEMESFIESYDKTYKLKEKLNLELSERNKINTKRVKI